MEGAVLKVFGMCLFILCTRASDCDLSEVQLCVGEAGDLVTSMYFTPLNEGLLSDIKENHCSKGIEGCLQGAKGNCSKTVMSPYQTIVNTISFICNTDFDVQSSCLIQFPAQHAFEFCFQMFKVVIDNVISDVTLDKPEMDERICSALDDVISCSAEAAITNCDIKSQNYVISYLNAATFGSRDSLSCLL